MLFELAANAGSADPALPLGSTYDPNVIKRLGAIMVKPDVENARKWYQLAADRGSAAASLQLANFATKPLKSPLGSRSILQRKLC